MMNSMRSMRRKKDLAIEGLTARWYNRNTRKHRMKEMKEYAALVRMDLKPGDTVLELAPGPGYLSIELAKMGNYKVVGVEISKTFVDIARNNAKAAGVDVDFRQGSASDIRCPDGSFNAIVCTAAFKNFREPVRALAEMYRVLKPNGTVLIVDMNREATDAQVDQLLAQMNAKGFEAMFLKLTFKYFLRKGAYTRAELTEMLSAMKWRSFDIEEEGIGFRIWLKK
jgi:ubiquinone/menaquinone biosynthesis C-methylase UbiE